MTVSDLETYWAIDSSSGGTLYIAPVVRFRLSNKGAQPQRGVEATATFRRAGEEQTWGSDWSRATPPGKELAAGQDTMVTLKSDARYFSTGTPESMFTHALFKDARVEVFVRVGASSWIKMVEVTIERRIGSRSVRDVLR